MEEPEIYRLRQLNLPAISTQWQLVAVIMLIALAPQAYKLIMPPVELTNGFISDDTFYYLKTARNISAGLGSTFDTINPTNGYHPLWMLVLSVLAMIPHSILGFYYVALGANLLLVAAVSLLVFIMFKDYLGVFLTGFLLVLMNGAYVSAQALFSGKETALYILLLLLSIQVLSNISFADRRKLLALSALFGLTFLARTEFALFAPTFALYVGYKLATDNSLKLKEFVAGLPYLTIPFLVIVTPYLAWNRTQFGSFQQLSGLIKSREPSDTLESVSNFVHTLKVFGHTVYGAIEMRPTFAGVFMLAVVVLFGYVWVRGRGRLGFFADRRIVLLSLFALTVFAYYFVEFGALRLRSWHLAVVYITAQILFVHAIRYTFLHFYRRVPIDWPPSVDLRNPRQATLRLMGSSLSAARKAPWIAVILLLVLAMAANHWVKTPYYRFAHRNSHIHYVAPKPYQHFVSEWIRDNVPDEATVGLDDAGYVGYFSDKKIVNLDGLANGREFYWEYLERGRGVDQYIIDKKIDYVTDYYFGEPSLPQSPLLGPKLELVYNVGRSDIVRQGIETFVDWYVWKVHHDR